MLMRILADNPGHSFTRNFDAKFVATFKDLLRYGRDWHVQHYLRQYLNTLEATKASDQDLQLLLQMWAKEKTKNNRNFVSISGQGQEESESLTQVARLTDYPWQATTKHLRLDMHPTCSVLIPRHPPMH